jgi:peptidyl-prolyl cis-trans isomerase SurA
MKKALLFIMLTLAASIVPVCGFAKQVDKSLDQIVAVVNDDVITTSELSHGMKLIKIQTSQHNLSTAAEAALRKQVLETLVNKKLQLQAAKQVGITVSEHDLDSAVKSVADMNRMSVADLYQRLSTEGMSVTDYKSEMREQLTIQKLQQQEVINRINISPEEVSSFMRSKAWQTNSSNEYHLQDILIPLSDAATSNDISAARKQSEAVMTKLNNGQSFESVTGSENSAIKGGDLGWRKLPEIPSAFAEQVAHMQAKEVAGPIQTSNGFHIIRLAAVRALASKDGAPTRKQIENLLLQQKFEQAIQNWVSKLRSQAFINMNPMS